jgi:cytochrome c-type biogenesis protein CcmH
MTMFWLMAAVLVALALAMVLPPLLQQRATAPVRADNLAILREQQAQLAAEQAAGALTPAQYDLARLELQRRVLEEDNTHSDPARHVVHTTRSPQTAVLLGLGLPALAVALYLQLGNPQAALLAPADRDTAVSMQAVEDMVSAMAQRLNNPPPGQPPGAQDWDMLARSYAALQNFAQADAAYVRAIALAPGNAQLLTDRADVLAMLQGRSAAGEPTRLVDQALKIDPDNLKALAMAGSIALERGDYAGAVRHWSRARALSPAGSEFATGLDRSLVEARAGLAASGTAAQAAPPVVMAQATTPASPATTPARAAGAALSGEVHLAPALAARVAAGDTLFIFARAANGPRMPLAIVRRTAGELPVRFTLDDSTAMTPEMRLSKFSEVVVGARISKSGNAMPQSGDLLGQSAVIKPGAAGIRITISDVQR